MFRGEFLAKKAYFWLAVGKKIFPAKRDLYKGNCYANNPAQNSSAMLVDLLGISSNDLKPKTLTRNPDFTLLYYSTPRSLSSTFDYIEVPYSIFFYRLSYHQIPKFKAIRFPRVECNLTLSQSKTKNHVI